MTTKELFDLIDSKGTYTLENGLRVSVTIRNARESYGRIDLLITPEAGDGQAWVWADKVEVEK